MYGTQPFSIVRRQRAGRTSYQVTDLASGRITTHSTKREATAQAKRIERGQDKEA